MKLIRLIDEFKNDIINDILYHMNVVISSIEELLLQRLYFILDIKAGNNVNIVLDSPYDWDKIETDYFNMVISGQAFEHIEFFWITMIEMTRVLKKDGVVCIIAPFGFGEHKYPVDCFRFTSDGLIALAKYVGLDILYSKTIGKDSVIIAKKLYSGPTKCIDVKNYKI